MILPGMLVEIRDVARKNRPGCLKGCLRAAEVFRGSENYLEPPEDLA